MRPGLHGVGFPRRHGLDVGPEQIPGEIDRERLGDAKSPRASLTSGEDRPAFMDHRGIRSIRHERGEFSRGEPGDGIDLHVGRRARGLRQARRDEGRLLMPAQGNIGQGEFGQGARKGQRMTPWRILGGDNLEGGHLRVSRSRPRPPDGMIGTNDRLRPDPDVRRGCEACSRCRNNG